jgi:hypothetical protein
MTRSIFMAFGIAALFVLIARVEGQDRAAGNPRDFAKRGATGPEHERLQRLVGAWTLTAQGTKEKGRAEYRSILGGRFVTEEIKLPFGGFTMEWLGIYGYDKQKKRYTAVWVDNMDTTTEIAEGDASADGKVLTFRGEHTDPHTGQPASYVYRVTRDGDAKITIHMIEVGRDGKEEAAFVIRGEKVRSE